MKPEDILTYVWMGMAALSALGILVARNVLYAALLLIVCLISLAGVYLMLNAEFLAVTQIMIYAGGVLVLIIFGVMLTARLSGKALSVQNQNRLAGALTSVLLLAILGRGLSGLAFPDAPPPPTKSIQACDRYWLGPFYDLHCAL